MEKTKLSNADQKQVLSIFDSVVTRAQLASRLGQTGYGANRDIYEALGYIRDLKWSNYYTRYQRQGVAKRIIHAPADASWRKKPVIIEDQKKETSFEKAWADFETEHRVFHYLHRIDRISGIGEYGALLMGFKDGKELAEDVGKNGQELLYLRPYTQLNADIKEWVKDPKDPRFGLPLLYKLTSANADRNGTNDLIVHHSRILHVAETLVEDEVFGVPRLMAVYNYLQDLETVSGGSAEMYWRGAFPGMAFNLDPEADDVGQSLDQMTTEIENYVHGLKRYLKLQGVEVNNLAPQVSDPSKHVDMLMDLISTTIEMPKRILMGSERGELASSQDETAWNNRIEERRRDYNEPKLLRPFIDRMGEVGILKIPNDGYEVDWPDIHAAKEIDVAMVSKVKAETLKVYADSPNSELILPKRIFLKDFLDYKDEQIDEMEDMIDEALVAEQKEIDESEVIEEEVVIPPEEEDENAA